MLFKNHFILTTVAIFINLKLYANGDDEDSIDPKMSFYMILIGLAFLGIGAIISQAKFAEGFGKIISGIGLFIGGFGILGLALILLEWAIKTAITLAIFIGGLFLVGYILYHIYMALFSKKKE